MRKRTPIFLLLGLSPALACAETSEGERLYLEKIRPLLAAKCLACHGEDPRKLKGEFDMRTREGMLTGGESKEPALVPGHPEKSPLYVAVTWKDSDLEMPPKKNDRLSEEQIAHLRKWIELGAPWVEGGEAIAGKGEAGKGGVTIETSGGTSAEWTKRRYRPEDVWAYRPVVKPDVPVVKGSAHPIDAFIARKLAEAGLKAALRADQETLRRRASYGLTGLPPRGNGSAPADWNAFVEHLLASPRYGERMAQHWLDVVRYADTSGFANDWERPHAWRYRDYVIRAFNEDKPYDQFVKEQIAGDELAPGDAAARIATGYLRMGPWEQTAMSVAAVTRQQFLDDVTNSVGETFLAQGLRCASCHDHKFDPVPTRDYYRIQAVFASTQFADAQTPFQDWESREFARRKAHLEKIRELEPQPITKLDQENSFGRITKKRSAYLKSAMARFDPKSFGVVSAGGGETTQILKGGALASPGEAVEPGTLSAIEFQRDLPAGGAGRRRALAEWIAHRENPLTARVIVNRVWQWHFGTGLVAAANNFGKMGGRPSHPELLDWLASWFVENGWSIKKLHRLIMTSEAYRRGGRAPDPGKAEEVDPNNRLLSWFPTRRLSAEEIRDSMLQVSGELDLTMGGPGVFPIINEEVALQPRHIMGGIAMAYQPSPTRSLRNRRSIYVFRTRTLADPAMEVFNKPGPDVSCEKRDETIVTPQVFALFNSEGARDRAVAFADRVARGGGDASAKVTRAFKMAYGRDPTSAQRAAALAHLQALTAQHERVKVERAAPRTTMRREMVAEQSGEFFAWTERLVTEHIEPDLKLHDLPAETRALADLCLVLFNSSEFLYVY